MGSGGGGGGLRQLVSYDQIPLYVGNLNVSHICWKIPKSPTWTQVTNDEKRWNYYLPIFIIRRRLNYFLISWINAGTSNL